MAEVTIHLERYTLAQQAAHGLAAGRGGNAAHPTASAPGVRCRRLLEGVREFGPQLTQVLELKQPRRVRWIIAVVVTKGLLKKVTAVLCHLQVEVVAELGFIGQCRACTCLHTRRATDNE